MYRFTTLSTTLSVLFGCFSTYANASEQSWKNDGEPAQIIELFTSEGCSSCPPADKYLSQFQHHVGLWYDFIPLAFHVDYWNYLGWKDEFSHPSFTQRQRLYKSYGAASSVYTPGFFVDGKEWRGYFSRSQLPVKSAFVAGELNLERIGNQFELSYSELGSYMAHFVLLAMDEKTKIKAGENRGKELEHDFVVLEKQQLLSESNWTFDISTWPDNADAVAVWLTKRDEFQPIQTVAGFLSSAE
ncbi:DUF1223 domain-containing protein [Vibrio algarum]|uniref:DUF1223 domain-containing protein n=1 Tax=Vibrio algarum TaxID=3020714 RepID=A0ABT4YQC0_9VIBR|nr:DUF1223 domain-containing protein [Vibrio sp. KJ40-1]MDB1123747.1 DUF1223 domain-containing protein [Vibrio sp. KJ40-1]